MKNTNDSIHSFSNFLKTLPSDRSEIPDDLRLKTLELLEDCWPFLKGSSEHSTYSNKIYRAKNIRWQPPILFFQLERHGATVNGSSRADLHFWEIDIDEGTATIVGIRHRQLEKMALRMDTRAKAMEVANNIVNGLDHPSLNWDNNREYVVINISQVIPEAKPQTTQSRRKRFRDRLDAVLLEQGWMRKDKGNKLGFIKARTD